MDSRFSIAATILLSTAAGFSQAAPGDTELVSVKADGSASAGRVFAEGLSVSADGRYVAFSSSATDLVPGGTDPGSYIFVRDRQSGTTQVASLDSSGVPVSAAQQSISSDGRYVAFCTPFDNVVPGDDNGVWDVFVRDRQSGITERVSVDSNGAQLNDTSNFPALSGNGRYVAFYSFAMGGGIFVHDRQTGLTELVSVNSSEVRSNGSQQASQISADGRYVAFASTATNLASGEQNGNRLDVFLRDRQAGLTERISMNTRGIAGNGESTAPSISADGRYVAFTSAATNLVSSDTNGDVDIFVKDRQTGVTERVNVTTSGVQSFGGAQEPSISPDGRFVAFRSFDNALVPGDSNGVGDSFVRDRATFLTERVSLGANGEQPDDESLMPAISGNDRFVAFISAASNLVSNDENAGYDVYVHERAVIAVTWTVTPSTLAFGNQLKGSTSAAQRATITNTGTRAMPIYGIALAGGSPSSFSQTNNCGTSLAAGANCRVDVVFKPSSTGSKSARLNVTAGAGNTKAVVLTGTGVNASVTYTLSPLSIDFGNQAKGTSSAARVVQVKNNGTSALAINSITLGGPSPTQYSRTTTCGTSLAAGASCQVSVFFKPLTTGTKNASLIVNGGSSPSTVTLTGVGTTS